MILLEGIEVSCAAMAPPLHGHFVWGVLISWAFCLGLDSPGGPWFRFSMPRECVSHKVRQTSRRTLKTFFNICKTRVSTYATSTCLVMRSYDTLSTCVYFVWGIFSFASYDLWRTWILLVELDSGFRCLENAFPINENKLLRTRKNFLNVR